MSDAAPPPDPRLRRHALGFLEIVDRPTPEALAAYYAQRYYQGERGNYRASYPPHELAVIRLRIAQKLACVQALRGERPPGRLLDVGCGEGYVLAALADEGWTVEGIDFASAGVEAMNPSVAERVETGDVFALLADRLARRLRYDLVWLGNVLEHVLEPVELLRALHGLVAPDGLLVVTVPNDGNAYHEGLFADGSIGERFWIAPPDHLSYFTAESLDATARATGWTCVDLLADFPIDLFLSHPGSNYVRDRGQGPAAHQARLRLEQVIGDAGPGPANDVYRALARVGLGRNLVAFLAPRPQKE